MTVEARQAKLELSTETVSIHKNGIEFRSPAPFSEWAEMTVTLQSPVSGYKVACTRRDCGLHRQQTRGYHVSMIFTQHDPRKPKKNWS